MQRPPGFSSHLNVEVCLVYIYSSFSTHSVDYNSQMGQDLVSNIHFFVSPLIVRQDARCNAI